LILNKPRHYPQTGSLVTFPSHTHACNSPFCSSKPVAGDQYLLQDGHKAAWVKPTVGVKQGCPLSPLLFSLYVNDIGSIAEGVQGAVTGTEDVRDHAHVVCR